MVVVRDQPFTRSLGTEKKQRVRRRKNLVTPSRESLKYSLLIQRLTQMAVAGFFRYIVFDSYCLFSLWTSEWEESKRQVQEPSSCLLFEVRVTDLLSAPLLPFASDVFVLGSDGVISSNLLLDRSTRHRAFITHTSRSLALHSPRLAFARSCRSCPNTKQFKQTLHPALKSG